MNTAETIRPRLRTATIIAGAIMFGLISVTGIFLFLAQNQNPPGANVPALGWLAWAVLAINTVVSQIMPNAIVNTEVRRIGSQAPQAGEVERLLGLYQTSLIIYLAVLEGAGFLGAMAFLINRDYALLAIPAFALVLMAMRFPTEPGMTQWLETQARRVEEMRTR